MVATVSEKSSTELPHSMVMETKSSKMVQGIGVKRKNSTMARGSKAKTAMAW